MENLGDLIKIVATVIGLVIYWTMSNKNKAKKKLSEGPTEVAPPLAPRQKPVVIQEEYVDESPKYEPVSFEELLEQFGESKKKPPTRAERELNSGIDDEFIPATATKEETKKELTQFYQELHDEEFKITEADLASNRAEGFELKKKQQHRVANLLRSPEGIRDAIILKEIFDRKYF